MYVLHNDDESGLLAGLKDTVPHLMYIKASQNTITSYEKESRECTKDSTAAMLLNRILSILQNMIYKYFRNPVPFGDFKCSTYKKAILMPTFFFSFISD